MTPGLFRSLWWPGTSRRLLSETLCQVTINTAADPTGSGNVLAMNLKAEIIRHGPCVHVELQEPRGKDASLRLLLAEIVVKADERRKAMCLDPLNRVTDGTNDDPFLSVARRKSFVVEKEFHSGNLLNGQSRPFTVANQREAIIMIGRQ